MEVLLPSQAFVAKNRVYFCFVSSLHPSFFSVFSLGYEGCLFSSSYELLLVPKSNGL